MTQAAGADPNLHKHSSKLPKRKTYFLRNQRQCDDSFFRPPAKKKKNKTKANRNRNAPNLFLMVGTFINQLHGDDKPKKKIILRMRKIAGKLKPAGKWRCKFVYANESRGFGGNGKWELGTQNGILKTENCGPDAGNLTELKYAPLTFMLIFSTIRKSTEK